MVTSDILDDDTVVGLASLLPHDRQAEIGMQQDRELPEGLPYDAVLATYFAGERKAVNQYLDAAASHARNVLQHFHTLGMQILAAVRAGQMGMEEKQALHEELQEQRDLYRMLEEDREITYETIHDLKEQLKEYERRLGEAAQKREREIQEEHVREVLVRHGSVFERLFLERAVRRCTQLLARLGYTIRYGE